VDGIIANRCASRRSGYRDERESGLRRILNLGHTFGTRLEAETGYTRFLHGRRRVRHEAAVRLAESTAIFPRGQRGDSGRLDLYGRFRRLTALRRRACWPGWSTIRRPCARRALCDSRADWRGRGGFGVDERLALAAIRSALHEGTTRPARATNAKPPLVRDMFGRVAHRYDLANHLLSFNIDRLWRAHTARRVRSVLERPGARVLDICCGTATWLWRWPRPGVAEGRRKRLPTHLRLGFLPRDAHRGGREDGTPRRARTPV